MICLVGKNEARKSGFLSTLGVSILPLRMQGIQFQMITGRMIGLGGSGSK